MYSISLRRLSLNAHQSSVVSAARGAVYVVGGRVQCGGREVLAEQGLFCQGEALELAAGQEPSTVLLFDVRQHMPEEAPLSDLLLAKTVQFDPTDCLMRLDRVTFPAGAVAYRHVHSGPGIRYLTRGALHVQADDHSMQMQAGHAWFEAAESPVKASADAEQVSEFVRVLLLPRSFTGKPTIRLLNESDLHKPRLQQNHRFFDEPLVFPETS